jgi:alpha-beta hydrolase superfamily lysophospholipase
MNVAVQHGEGSLLAVGRLRLRYRCWEPPHSRAALIIVHGLAEHSGRYAKVGEHLATHGFATFSFDLRGHGLSEGRRGHAESFDCFLQDLDRFRREIEGVLDPHTPIFLLGHSMGGLITLRYLEEYDAPVRGAIIISPWLATAIPVPRWKATLANAIGRVFPALPFRARIDAAHLSRDPEIVRAYREDPLVHDIITPRLFAAVSKAMGLVTQQSDRLRVPTFFLLAGADRLVDAERSAAFARYLPASQVTVKVYPGHFHELLNEPDRITILRDVRAWLGEQIDGRAAAAES